MEPVSLDNHLAVDSSTNYHNIKNSRSPKYKRPDHALIQVKVSRQELIEKWNISEAIVNRIRRKTFKANLHVIYDEVYASIDGATFPPGTFPIKRKQ
ncbi:MAG: hypothetical protein NE330_15035 [Lentisphaeraceae bacterium]|nr:hypothetical protein [Lentisphaeraceae bacterium]